MANQWRFFYWICFCSLISWIATEDLNVHSILCPDEQSYCPDGETCCQLSSGQYGCCPLPDAVCCTDHLHCCPHGYSCDVEHGRCQKGLSINSTNAICPDGSTSCSEDETCCQISSSASGCCPLRDAVCCSDQVHCCPHGYQCHVEEERCVKGPAVVVFVEWKEKQIAHRRDRHRDEQRIFLVAEKSEETRNMLRLENSLSKGVRSAEIISSSPLLQPVGVGLIQCPDGRSVCPEETTCCALTNGTFGCCPYGKGICCDDQKHCCPEKYLCDPNGWRCFHHSSKEMFSPKIRVEPVAGEQICPDGLKTCSANSTCCPNSPGGSYACCPYPRGICCGPIGEYCCPEKYRCDEENLSCLLSEEEKIFQQCGASEQFCRRNETCCSSASASNGTNYSCCPLTKGVCCGDGKHCCPSSSSCESLSEECLQWTPGGRK